MRSLLFLLWFTSIQLAFLIYSPAQESLFESRQEIFLWAGTPPGSENLQLEEVILDRSTDTLIRNRAFSSIGKPSIFPYLPENPNGTAILICPGGAYSHLTFDKEGVDIAEWFNSIGVSAFILKYRLPAEGHSHRKNVPLMDAQRALRVIRAHADEWKIDTSKIGVIGFSAGGHLASSLGTLFDKDVYTYQDSADQESARPDFMILMYPVISMKDPIMHAGSKKNLLGASPVEDEIIQYSTNLQITNTTPPTFIVHASDDKAVLPENSLLFYRGLLNANVIAELHMFEKGGHGFGIRQARGTVSNWTLLCEQWLLVNGFCK
jgi:acetyl esterase/lipase